MAIVVVVVVVVLFTKNFGAPPYLPPCEYLMVSEN